MCGRGSGYILTSLLYQTTRPIQNNETHRELDRLQRHYRGKTYTDSDDEGGEYEVLMVYHDAGLEGDGPHAVVRHTRTGAWRCRPPVSVPGYLARKLPLPPPPPPSSAAAQPAGSMRPPPQQQRAVVGGAPAFGPGPARARHGGGGGGDDVQRWKVTACHLVGGEETSSVGGSGRPRKYATVVREDRAGGPRICGPCTLCMYVCAWKRKRGAWALHIIPSPTIDTIHSPNTYAHDTVITPRGVPLEPGTTFVLPRQTLLPIATPIPASLQAGSKAPSTAPSAAQRGFGAAAAHPASAPLPDSLPDASPRELLYVGGCCMYRMLTSLLGLVG